MRHPVETWQVLDLPARGSTEPLAEDRNFDALHRAYGPFHSGSVRQRMSAAAIAVKARARPPAGRSGRQRGRGALRSWHRYTRRHAPGQAIRSAFPRPTGETSQAEVAVTLVAVRLRRRRRRGRCRERTGGIPQSGDAKPAGPSCTWSCPPSGCSRSRPDASASEPFRTCRCWPSYGHRWSRPGELNSASGEGDPGRDLGIRLPDARWSRPWGW
jgi:hypothetical protein